MSKSCEIIKRERGPDEWPALTLELDYPYRPEMAIALKNELPRGTRIWAGDGDGKWHVHPDCLDKTVEIAYRFFGVVYVTDDEGTVEVRSGRRLAQQDSMF